jgi:hypothetical protein
VGDVVVGAADRLVVTCARSVGFLAALRGRLRALLLLGLRFPWMHLGEASRAALAYNSGLWNSPESPRYAPYA